MRVRSKVRHKRQVASILLYVLLVLSISFGLNYFLRGDDYFIGPVRITGASELDPVLNQKVSMIVERELAGAYVGLFPKRNLWLYPKEEIISLLRAELPELEKVEVDLSGRLLNVNITEYRQEYFWCQRDLECYAFINFLIAEGIEIGAVRSSGDPDVVVETVGGWYIIYERGELVESLSRRYLAALASLALDGKDTSLLEYIDLRFGNKIYYKFKDEK
ncbi:MAG TPA: hypothetical protein VJB98_04280 [Candidatus Paceibacterota bacterium]